MEEPEKCYIYMYIQGCDYIYNRVTVQTEEKNMCVIGIMMFIQFCVLCKLKAT